MTVANIPARDAALSVEPTTWAIVIGILFHQWADFSWAVFFFGVLRRWTAGLRPFTLLLVAVPWAVFTSATEWLLLVPLVPFWQPIFPLEQPYWIGFLVHLSSALMYPFFPWLRDRMSGAHSSANARFAKMWAILAASGMIVIAGIALCGSLGYEVPWYGHNETRDQAFMRRMSAHHAQGIMVAAIAAKRAQNPHLRALARLIAAEQIGENRIFAHWWMSWFHIPLEMCTDDERDAMPGMLTIGQVQALKEVSDSGFDRLFIDLMSFHHLGAARMADEELHTNGDPRLRIMAHAIRHAQQGEIELMHGTEGLEAVSSALQDLVSARLVTP